MNRVKILCFVILCIVLFACNGSPQSERLYKEIDHMNTESYRYGFINLDSAVYYANKAIHAASEINYEQGLAEAYNNLGYAYIPLSKYDSAYICFNYNISRNNDLEAALGHIGKANIAMLTCNHSGYYENIYRSDSLLNRIKQTPSNRERFYYAKSQQLITSAWYEYLTDDIKEDDFKQHTKDLKYNLGTKYLNQNILLDCFLGCCKVKDNKIEDALLYITRYADISDEEIILQINFLNLLAIIIQSDSSTLEKINELNIPFIPKEENVLQTVSSVYNTIIKESIEAGGAPYIIAKTYYKLGNLYNNANNFKSGMNYLDSALLYMNLHYELNHATDMDTLRMIRHAINKREFIAKEPVFKKYDSPSVPIQDTISMNAEKPTDRVFLFWLEMIREQYLVACTGIQDEKERLQIFDYNYSIFNELDKYVALSRSAVHVREQNEREEKAENQKLLGLISISSIVVLIIIGMILMSSQKERKRTKDLSLINKIGQNIIQSGKKGIMSGTTPNQCITANIFNDIKTLFTKIDLLKVGLYDPVHQELLLHYHLIKGSTIEIGSESYSLKDDEMKNRPEVVCLNLFNTGKGVCENGIICLPLISYTNNLPLGIVSIQSFTHKAFGRYEMLLLKSITPYITIAIENRQLFDELVEVKKTEQLGYMARGISHEIGSSMGASRLSALQLKKLVGSLHQELSATGKTSEILKKIEYNANFIINEIKSITGIIDSFKLLSRDNIHIEKKEFNVYEKLQDILKSFTPRLRSKNISVELKCSHILMIKNFPGEFSLVLGNLLKNSLQHGFKKRDKGNIEIIVQTDPGKTNLTLIYKDDGEGIAPEVAQHIFDISYTTDPNGSTGLGLNIVRQILAKIGGSIVFNSSVENGVEFIINIKLA